MLKKLKRLLKRWSISRLQHHLSRLDQEERAEFLTNHFLKTLNDKGVRLIAHNPKVIYITMWCHTNDDEELEDKISIETGSDLKQDRVVVKRFLDLY